MPTGIARGRTGAGRGGSRSPARLPDPDVGALIVYSHDRAWRNLKELLSTADECQRLGVAFILVKDGLDVTSAQGRFLLSLLGSFAEFESNISGERRTSAIAWLRRTHGQHLGLAPFGTERARVDGHLHLVPSTAPQPNGTDYDCLRVVYEVYAQGELGVTRLTQHLNSAGWRFRTVAVGKELKLWTPGDVRRVLHNHWLYAGYIVIGRKAQGADYELVRGNHGALLPPHLTEAVAARLLTHPRGWRLSRNLAFPLTGLLTCAACGLHLTGLSFAGGRRYYRHAMKCSAGGTFSYAADLLHSTARERLASLQVPAPYLNAARDGLIERYAAGQGGAAERARLEGELERARELYISGDLSREQYDLRKARTSTYLERLGELESQLNPGEVQVTADLAQVQTAPPGLLQSLLRALYAQVRVRGRTREFELEWVAQNWCREWA